MSIKLLLSLFVCLASINVSFCMDTPDEDINTLITNCAAQTDKISSMAPALSEAIVSLGESINALYEKPHASLISYGPFLEKLLLAHQHLAQCPSDLNYLPECIHEAKEMLNEILTSDQQEDLSGDENTHAHNGDDDMLPESFLHLININNNHYTVLSTDVTFQITINAINTIQLPESSAVSQLTRQRRNSI